MVYTFPITGKDRETMLHSKTMTQVLKACPAEAICYQYGFGNEKTKENS